MKSEIPLACPEFEQPLRLYVAGTLAEAQKVRVAQHLVHCEACCEELAWLYSLRDALSHALQPDATAQTSLERIFHSVVNEGCAPPLATGADDPLPELQKLRHALKPRRALGTLKDVLDIRKLTMDLEIGPLVVSIL